MLLAPPSLGCKLNSSSGPQWNSAGIMHYNLINSPLWGNLESQEAAADQIPGGQEDKSQLIAAKMLNSISSCKSAVFYSCGIVDSTGPWLWWMGQFTPLRAIVSGSWQTRAATTSLVYVSKVISTVLRTRNILFKKEKCKILVHNSAAGVNSTVMSTAMESLTILGPVRYDRALLCEKVFTYLFCFVTTLGWKLV